MIDIKTCVYCGIGFVRPDYISKSMFKKRRFCTPNCGYNHHNASAAMRDNPGYELLPEPLYDRIDNTQYNQEMSEVTGISRLYLDGRVNLDTLRIMEVSL